MHALVKVCGVRTVDDALFAVEAGAQLIGLNFVSSSPRAVSVERALSISRALRGRAELIGVVADLTLPQLHELRVSAGLDTLQLHGDEPVEWFKSLSSQDYKAVRVADNDDVAHARRYLGPRLLVDAKVAGVLGGSGHTFDWSLVTQLARERTLLLAGGLRPDNVALAVRQVRPWAVDVASGVESAPGIKDPTLVRAFLDAALSESV